jgi:hypothetical protein
VIPNGTVYPAGVPTVSSLYATSDVTITSTIVLTPGFFTEAGATFPDGVTVPPYVIDDPNVIHNNPLLAGTLVEAGFRIPSGSVAQSDWVLNGMSTFNVFEVFPPGTILPPGTIIDVDGFSGDGSTSFLTLADTVTNQQFLQLPQGSVIAAGSVIIAAPFSFYPVVPIPITSPYFVPNDMPVTGDVHIAAGSVLASRSVLPFNTVVPACQALAPTITGPPPVFYKCPTTKTKSLRAQSTRDNRYRGVAGSDCRLPHRTLAATRVH